MPLYKHKCHSSISINYCKTLLISKQTVNLDMNLSFSDLSEFCKIVPQSAGNGISETLDFTIFRGGMPPGPLDVSWLRHSILTPSAFGNYSQIYLDPPLVVLILQILLIQFYLISKITKCT